MRRSDHVLTYLDRSEKNGKVIVPDLYQWLEHNTEETDKWTTAQAAFTRAYLDQNPERDALEGAFTVANNYAKLSAPQLHDDGRWYWYYNTGLQAQTCLWRTKDDKIPEFSKQLDEDVGEIFFDPNALSKDGTAALSTYRFSRDGKYFAYAITQCGSNFNTIYVRPTDSPLTKWDDSGTDPSRLPDEIKFVKFSGITWAPNSEGFFYQRYPDINGATLEKGGIATRGDRDAMVYYHRVGTPQSEDILIHRDPANPEWMFGVDVTEDGEYIELCIHKDSSRKNMLWVANFDMNKIGEQFQWRKVINDFAAEYDVITNQGPIYYFRTDDGAPKHKILSINIDTNERKLLVPESEDAALSSTACVNKNYMALIYKRNVKDEIHLYTLEGKLVRRLAEDFVGACTVSGKEKQPWFFVTMSGFTSPSTVGRYNFQIPEEENRWSIFRAAKIKNLNPNDFEASQVWFKGKDGTNVPMFVVHHKATPFDPALQYGYGGFSISIDPFFSTSTLTSNGGSRIAALSVPGPLSSPSWVWRAREHDGPVPASDPGSGNVINLTLSFPQSTTIITGGNHATTMTVRAPVNRKAPRSSCCGGVIYRILSAVTTSFLSLIRFVKPGPSMLKQPKADEHLLGEGNATALGPLD